MKKIVILIISLLYLYTLTGCTSGPDIKIGLSTDGNKLSNIISKVPSKLDLFAEYIHNKSFNANYIEIVIFSGDEAISGGSNTAKESDKSVIVPITFPRPGVFQMKVFISDKMVYQEEIVVY